jgi:neutral ceramidase
MRVGGKKSAVVRVVVAFAVVATCAVALPAPVSARAVTPAQAQPAFQVATARLEITPTALGFPDYYRAGYGSSQPVHVTSGAPLYATGLLMVNSAGERWVLVAIDVLGLPTAVTDQLQADVQSQFGIPPQRLLLGGSHTHSGPVLIDQPNTYITYGVAPGTAQDQLVQAYTTALRTRIVELIGTLVSAPTVSVTATFATGVANAAFNRSSARPTVTEPSVPVLTLRAAADQRIVAVVFSFAAHPVTAGGITTWNPDYPGAAVASVEAQLSGANPGVRALYLRGAGGDQDPPGGFTPQSLGNLIATQVVAAATGAPGTGSAPVYEPESAGFQDVVAPLDIRVSDATLRAHYAAVLAAPPSDADRKHAQVMIQAIDGGTLRRAMKIQVTAWRFAAPPGGRPVGMVAMAGEALADYSVGFQHVLGGSYRMWTVTQTNGHPGYLPPDEVLARGDGCPGSGCFYHGYEAGWEVVEGTQRYPIQSSTTYNDGLVAPLAAGTDNLLCRSASALLTGAAADCTDFTPGRVVPHAALASTGPALAGWTDGSGRPRLEVLALGADRCLRHRSYTGDANGALTGTWSGWDAAPICGGIVGPSAADAWVDAAGRARIETVVRTGDGSLFHGRCTGDASGCANRPWQWTQIATPADGVSEQPELSVWQQQDGRLRIDVFAVRGAGRCLSHRGFVGTDNQGNGSWGGWTAQPGCGGIIGPAAAVSWRAGTALRHDVVVRTGSGALYAVRCAGTESSCAWGTWTAMAGPPGVAVVDAPTYTTAPSATGRRFDLYVRDGANCIWHAAWTTNAIPAAPPWRRLAGCGLGSRVGAVDWRDAYGRSRSTVAALDVGANGPLWVRQTTSRSGAVADDVLGDWEDIADPSMAISNP